jgi:hypothetical protein
MGEAIRSRSAGLAHGRSHDVGWICKLWQARSVIGYHD